MKVPAFLKNKYVLYFLVLIAIVNVLGYISLEKYNFIKAEGLLNEDREKIIDLTPENQ